MDEALNIVRTRLEQDSSLSDRTELSPEDQIVRLCEVCLKQYFLYMEIFMNSYTVRPWAFHFLQYCVTFIWTALNRELLQQHPTLLCGGSAI